MLQITFCTMYVTHDQVCTLDLQMVFEYDNQYGLNNIYIRIDIKVFYLDSLIENGAYQVRDFFGNSGKAFYFNRFFLCFLFNLALIIFLSTLNSLFCQLLQDSGKNVFFSLTTQMVRSNASKRRLFFTK